MLKGFLDGQKECSREEYMTYLEQVGAKGLLRRRQETGFAVDGTKHLATFTWGKTGPLLLKALNLSSKEDYYYTSKSLRKLLKLEEYSK